VHDDCLISAALVAYLDRVEWAGEVEGEIIPPQDGWAGEGGGRF
jgi:hypothetical protein